MKMGTLEVYSLTKTEKKSFIDTYEQFYFVEKEYTANEKELLGTILKNKSSYAVEEYADKVLDRSIPLDKRVFLWKAGRLTKEYSELKDADLISQIKVRNGRGHEIDNADEFIYEIKNMTLVKGEDGFKENYKKFLEISKQVNLKNVGAVYLITILFFLSNKEYPIYDYFAHKAVKALYLDKKPNEIFVGEAPDKKELDKVIAMYGEYVYLLDQVFGYHNIERKLDRSLWVYGHYRKEE